MLHCILAALALLHRRRRAASMPTVYLEGTIAARKSSLAAALATTTRFAVAAEPVDVWQNLLGVNFLALLGADCTTWGFPFQVLAMATIAERDRQAHSSGKVTVCERSIACALSVFTQDLLHRGALRAEHLVVLHRLRLALEPSVRPAHYFYIRTPPRVAYSRMLRRGRDEESRLPLESFFRLHNLLDEWLLNQERHRVTVIDGSLAPEAVTQEALRALEALAASPERYAASQYHASTAALAPR